jgi:hypothetical protein
MVVSTEMSSARAVALNAGAIRNADPSGNVACLDAMRWPSSVRTSIFTSSVCLSASRIRYCDYLTQFYIE